MTSHDDETTDPLDPADLELPESFAKPLGDNRFVITSGADGPTPPEVQAAAETPARAYEFALSLRVEGVHAETAISTNDLGAAFEDLLLAVTEAVAPDLPPEQALRVLLAATSLEP
ncbi:MULTISPECIES: hypothetical protein [unclassified Haladaptatus]|uniref:DUF7500 family protein n=1 Tax=unclassified Haladaptatus TaxID=2622732 RepID=UPI0023E897AF|nr:MULTISPECIES: hypothetical protein [unclassified Haladaptatus]